MERLREFNGWVIRERLPSDRISKGRWPIPLILLLHGYTGNEDSMWIFQTQFPENAWVLAPRGLYSAPHGGYHWMPGLSPGKLPSSTAASLEARPWIDDFHPAISRILELLQPENFPEADLSAVEVVGFSQGAALAYAFAMYHPSRIRAVAGLAGFIPQGAQAIARDRPLQGKPAFVAHGNQDETVPIEEAREAARILSLAGAEVSFCEDDVGHKMSPDCFRGLGAFLREHLVS